METKDVSGGPTCRLLKHYPNGHSPIRVQGVPPRVVSAKVDRFLSQPTQALLSSLQSRTKGSCGPHEVDMQSVAKARRCLDRGDGLTKTDCSRKTFAAVFRYRCCDTQTGVN